MKKLMGLALLTLTFHSFSQDSYSNFPTISNEFKTKEECQEWLSSKKETYSSRVIRSEKATGCFSRRVHMPSSHSSKVPRFRTVIEGKVTLDTL
jgi:hypothetical protein